GCAHAENTASSHHSLPCEPSPPICPLHLSVKIGANVVRLQPCHVAAKALAGAAGPLCCDRHTCLLLLFTQTTKFFNGCDPPHVQNSKMKRHCAHTGDPVVILTGGGHNGHVVVDRGGRKLPAPYRLRAVDASGGIKPQNDAQQPFVPMAGPCARPSCLAIK